MVISAVKPHQTVVTLGNIRECIRLFAIQNSAVLAIYRSLQVKVGLVSHKIFQDQAPSTSILSRMLRAKFIAWHDSCYKTLVPD